MDISLFFYFSYKKSKNTPIKWWNISRKKHLRSKLHIMIAFNFHRLPHFRCMWKCNKTRFLVYLVSAMLQNVHFLLAILSRDKILWYATVLGGMRLAQHFQSRLKNDVFFSTIFAIRLNGTICDNNTTPFSGILETLVHFRYTWSFYRSVQIFLVPKVKWREIRK